MIVNYDLLPERLREGARRYIEQGIRPGGFLTAIISNDLIGSMNRADHTNREQIFGIVRFFYQEAPSSCWGSAAKMKSWIAGFVQEK